MARATLAKGFSAGDIRGAASLRYQKLTRHAASKIYKLAMKSRKYIDVNDTMGFTDAPDRGIGGFGLAGKKSMCFHVAFRFTRIFLRYTVHMHVEEEFQNLIPGFRTN